MTAIRFEDAGRPIDEIGRHSAVHRAGNAGRRTLAKFGEWRRRSKDRARLAALDDRMLADIGVTRAEAEFLINKPFWRE
jgi:uncharacterized protein YjiS (DUF1127 family)